uniref:Uncharacterized protein n=1 Tax=Rousettus aegyptiacus TaxID=9407 RepID=A0A7J8DHW1_ROUAE|nr:hypothetical protein HJG63_008575 [Rousettus aegyptiacus]
MLPSDPHTSCLTALGEDGIRAFPLLLKWLHWSTQKGQHRGVASQLWAGWRGSKPAPSLRTLRPRALMTLLCVTTSSSQSAMTPFAPALLLLRLLPLSRAIGLADTLPGERSGAAPSPNTSQLSTGRHRGPHLLQEPWPHGEPDTSLDLGLTGSEEVTALQSGHQAPLPQTVHRTPPALPTPLRISSAQGDRDRPDSTDLLGSLLSSAHRPRAAFGALGEGYSLQFASRRDLERMTSQSLATLRHLMFRSPVK